MGHWIYHWFWIDFWTPVWPNLAASAVLGGAVWWKLHLIQGIHKAHLEVLRELRVHLGVDGQQPAAANTLSVTEEVP